MTLGTVCSGIGCPEQALKNLGIEFEVAYYCEIDRFAADTYTQLHGVPLGKNLGDVTKIDIGALPPVDLFVGGTPCQDFSLAGLGAGGEENSGTRSSLMWNFLEIARRTKPRRALWENVKNACGERNRANFGRFLQALRDCGYAVSWKVLNAKDYGLPQNRERVFVVGDRGGEHFVFPPKRRLALRLKDMLDTEVDGKYYIGEGTLANIRTSTPPPPRGRRGA
jgi:DNA (cytosine-5)-methyltransferase 1